MSVRESEPQPTNWIIAHRFNDISSQQETYKKIRNGLIEGRFRASVYRLVLDVEPLIAILGEQLLPSAAQKIIDDAAIEKSRAAELPQAVSDRLRARRREWLFSPTGYSWENT